MSTFGPKFFPPLGPATKSKPFTPDGWDRCAMANQVLPGLAHITHGGVKIKIDHKNKSGADGANPTCHGLEPQPIGLEVVTFDDDQREALAAIVQPLVPTLGRKQLPVSIDHPSLRVLGITSVLIVGASPLINMGKQRTKMTFDLLHWLPTTKKVATNTAKGAPVRKVDNVGPAGAAASNPAPTTQAGFCGPPELLQSGG